MKKFFSYVICLSLIMLCSITFVGCDTEYPASALYVGYNTETSYATIQSAIDASTFAGQYIVVNSGTYNENLNINKPVKITGRYMSVTITGEASVSSSGVVLDSLYFSGEDKAKVALEIFAEAKEISNITIKNCSFNKFTNYAVSSKYYGASVLKNLTLQKCSFNSNGISALYLENAEGITAQETTFDGNGNSQDESLTDEQKTHLSAIDLNFIAKEYKSVYIFNCDFRRNGSSEKTCGAVLLRLSNSATFDGEVVMDNCYFMSNPHDIVCGNEGQENSSIEVSVINNQSWIANVEKLT